MLAKESHTHKSHWSDDSDAENNSLLFVPLSLSAAVTLKKDKQILYQSSVRSSYSDLDDNQMALVCSFTYKATFKQTGP